MISPSQIATWRLCHRKWGFTYLGGERPPASKAMLIGTALHAKAETILTEGGLPDFSFASDAEQEAARLLPAILDYLPLNQYETFSEQKVECMIQGVHFGGRFDWLTRLDLNDQWELGDLKTTSNLKWAKTELELSTDPQVLVYSMAQTVTKPDKITCRWLYVQTRGAPLVREVKVKPDFNALPDLIQDGRDITIAWKDRPRPEDLEPNTSACDAYGGCPFRSKCVIDPGERLIALQRRMGVAIESPMAKQQTFEEMMAQATGIAEINPPTPPQVPFTEPEALTKSTPPGDEDGAKGDLPPVLDPEKADKPKRTRKAKATTPAPASPIEVQDAPETFIGTLYLNCMPLYDNEVEWADYIIASVRAEISQKMGVEDYRLIDFGKGAGILVAAVEDKIRHIRPSKLILDLHNAEGRLLSGPLTAMAEHVVRGL
jgi:PD-(D/E)XK nuclease superfamily